MPYPHGRAAPQLYAIEPPPFIPLAVTAALHSELVRGGWTPPDADDPPPVKKRKT